MSISLQSLQRQFTKLAQVQMTTEFDKGNPTLCVLRYKPRQADEGGRTGLPLTPGPPGFGAVSKALWHKLEQPQRAVKQL